MSTRQDQVREPPPWKLLLWTAVAGLVFGLIGFGEIAEDYLRVARNSLHRHSASGEIVLVKIDNESLRQVGRWPWPRRSHAELADKLTRAGAKRIFFDIGFFGPTDRANDQAFADALKRSGRVVLAARTRSGIGSGVEEESTPLPIFARNASVGSISWYYNYQNVVMRVPYGSELNGAFVSSYAALMAGKRGPANADFMPDYSLDPRSIPAVSAADVINGKLDPRTVAGKTVIIGATSDSIGDQFFVLGTGKLGGAYVHVIAAETLKSGIPVHAGWLPLFLCSLLVCGFALRLRYTSQRGAVLGGAAAAMVVGATFGDAHHVYFDLTPALFVLIVVAATLARRRYRMIGLINSVSNLPNLNALRADREGRNKAIVAVRVLNYEEIVATLPTDEERQLVDQIVARLNVGSPQRTLYQGDGGIFAWFEDPHHPFASQLEALSAMFRNPARLDTRSFDLSVTFGVEVGSGRSIANRLASALVAADEAAHHGLKWKYHDPESLEDASWKLSILSQLDEAIDRGEVWVAFQPKLDIATRQIVGAEALARWTHPVKGPIAATEFVAAAEQHDRIGKLTDFVLEHAVSAAAEINRRGTEFEIAVNLSARLLTDKGFTLRLAALLARHGLQSNRLTLELTETAALADHGEGLDMIHRLRDLGVNIAIDDYGTGQSTLEYLKKIPANEIKIDQSFVKGIVDNRSDRLMVQSTISLAHSLGRKVVAEGVEHRDILGVLADLECDIAQGFAIGRPMSAESLARRVSSARKRSAAA